MEGRSRLSRGSDETCSTTVAMAAEDVGTPDTGARSQHRDFADRAPAVGGHSAFLLSSEHWTKRNRNSVREFSSSRCSSRLRLPWFFRCSMRQQVDTVARHIQIRLGPIFLFAKVHQPRLQFDLESNGTNQKLKRRRRRRNKIEFRSMSLAVLAFSTSLICLSLFYNGCPARTPS